MSQVRLSFEGTNAIELAEILRGFPGCDVAVEVSESEVVRGDGFETAKKVIVTLTLAATMVKTGAEAGSSVVDFLDKLQDFQGGSQAVEKIVVIPEEGDRSSLTKPSGDALVKAIEENR
jgi:hypothetical protein